MSDRLFHRGMKITAYRATAGVPSGFVSSNPQFFDTLPNATEITDLRMQVKIEKSLDHEPNTCEVKISNCNPETRADLIKRPLIVRIEAGYDGTLRHLYTGDLRFGYNTRDNTEVITLLQLGDGERAYRYARVNRSYQKGTSVITAVREAAGSMGLIVDSSLLVSDDLQAQFASGRVLQGAARDELTLLLAKYGYHWSIQDGRMQILRDQDTRQDLAFVIDETTGMIQSPEFGTPEKNGKPPLLKVKVQLYPELTPGAQIEVRSDGVNGIFRIEKLTHNAGTANDDDWLTEIEAKSL